MTTATPIVLLSFLTGVTVLIGMPVALLLSHGHGVEATDGRSRHLFDLFRLTLTLALWLGFEMLTVTVWVFVGETGRLALLCGCTILAAVSVHAVYTTPGKTETDTITPDERAPRRSS